MKMKYPVNKEFFPLYHFTAPVGVRTIRLAQKHMRVPKLLWKDPELDVEMKKIPGYQGGEIEIYILTPKGFSEPGPCMINIHGGGFVFEGWTSHFKMAMRYAKETPCKVIYVRYRLAPDYPFPVPQEDCYAALIWINDHSDELGIDRNRIGLGGDSAGGTLSVTSCMMARDRGDAVRPIFQLLIYPWLDDRNVSESYHKYTDTPMWNSSLSKKVGPITNPHPETFPVAYRSPVEADSFESLPPAYIEVAEFDSLHDDGILYAELLKRSGIPALLLETKGTIHGFDTNLNAPTSRKMISRRIRFMRRMFYGKG